MLLSSNLYLSFFPPRLNFILFDSRGEQFLAIMSKRMTPEKVIHIIWLSVVITVCWPLPTSSGKSRIFGFKILQILSIISMFMLLLPMIYSSYLHFDDMILFSQDICLLIILTQLIMQTFICFVNHDSLQRVIEEMMIFIKEANQYEREIFCKYIEKCGKFCGVSIACMYMTAVCFALGPVFLPINFPLETEYPFRVNYTPVNIIVYMHQAFLNFQGVAHICLSMMGALLLWFAAARFECLAMEFQNCVNIPTLILCVKKQLRLRRYAKQVIDNFRFIVLYALAVSTFALTLCGIILIINVPMLVKMKFIILCFTVLAEIYLYTWPADYINDMSMNISQSAYNSMWYEQTIEFQRNLLSVIRYQKPLILSFKCVLSELSLRYYCSYLSNTFSIFTTLRILINKNLS